MKKYIGVGVVSMFMMSVFWVVAVAASTNTCDPTRAVMLPVSLQPRRIEIFGREVGHQAIQKLWEETTTKQSAHVTFGKIIAEEQEWFQSCSFPGIGIAVGSGYTLDSRNVIFFIWADEVNIDKARQSIVSYALTGTGSPITTSSSTTSSISTPTTTLDQSPVSSSTTVVTEEFFNQSLNSSVTTNEKGTSSHTSPVALSSEKIDNRVSIDTLIQKKIGRLFRRLCKQTNSNSVVVITKAGNRKCSRLSRDLRRPVMQIQFLIKTQINESNITIK